MAQRHRDTVVNPYRDPPRDVEEEHLDAHAVLMKSPFRVPGYTPAKQLTKKQLEARRERLEYRHAVFEGLRATADEYFEKNRLAHVTTHGLHFEFRWKYKNPPPVVRDALFDPHGPLCTGVGIAAHLAEADRALADADMHRDYHALVDALFDPA